MFAVFTSLLVAVLLVATHANYPIVNNNAYCTTGMANEPGTYASANACGDHCKSNSHKYFSWVPSSNACLCADNHSSPVANSYTNCYAIECPGYSLCSTGTGCGNNQIALNAGAADSADSCADKCKSYNYFNWITTTLNCFCVNTCTLHAQQSENTYAIGENSCPSLPNLRA